MTAPDPTAPILIVEDDKKTAALVAVYLEREGFRTLHASDGHSALAQARRARPQLVVLDLMLPGLDGWEVCRELRRASDVPILILTAREEEMDRVLGLSIGADDYVVKPFSPRELVARAKAILRRARPPRPPGLAARPVLTHRGLTLDGDKHQVTRDGKPVALTPHEFRLLQALMTSPGRVFTRQELIDFLHPGGVAIVDRVVDVHVGNLRKKIGDDSAEPRFILTVRGTGYRFADPAEPPDPAASGADG